MHFPYCVAHDVPLFLAPMAGVSESPFRQICRRFGADVVVSEFISSVGISLGIERVLAEMRFEPVERPIGIQIYGADAGVMAEPGSLHPDAVRVPGASPRALPGFEEGWFAVQDEASMVVAAALSVRPSSM